MFWKMHWPPCSPKKKQTLHLKDQRAKVWAQAKQISANMDLKYSIIQEAAASCGALIYVRFNSLPL
eukprot:3828294-Amphidinium_carterae.1